MGEINQAYVALHDEPDYHPHINPQVLKINGEFISPGTREPLEEPIDFSASVHPAR